MDVLEDKDVKARKTYPDDAYYVVLQFIQDEMFDCQEYRQIVAVKRQKGKIIPGQIYRRLVYKEDGKLVTWRESLPMSKLMNKYNLYDEY